MNHMLKHNHLKFVILIAMQYLINLNFKIIAKGFLTLDCFILIRGVGTNQLYMMLSMNSSITSLDFFPTSSLAILVP